MLRFTLTLLVLAALVLAVACESDDDIDATPTNTPDATEPQATEPPTPTEGTSGEDSVFRLTVTIDGVQMSEGHPGVGAQVNGNNCGSSLFVDGAHEIRVASDEGKGGCGTPGATVVFVLLGAGEPGGTEADETGAWDNTQVNSLEINFSTQQ